MHECSAAGTEHRRGAGIAARIPLPSEDGRGQSEERLLHTAF